MDLSQAPEGCVISFVCKYCQRSFLSVPEFIQHKVSMHKDILVPKPTQPPDPPPAPKKYEDEDTEDISSDSSSSISSGSGILVDSDEEVISPSDDEGEMMRRYAYKRRKLTTDDAEAMVAETKVDTASVETDKTLKPLSPKDSTDSTPAKDTLKATSAENPKATSAKDNPMSTSARENSGGTSAKDNRMATSGNDNAVATSAKDNSGGTSTKDNPMATSGNDNAVATSAKDNSGGTSTKNNPTATLVKDYSGGTSAKDNRKATSGNDNTMATSANDNPKTTTPATNTATTTAVNATLTTGSNTSTPLTSIKATSSKMAYYATTEIVSIVTTKNESDNATSGNSGDNKTAIQACAEQISENDPIVPSTSTKKGDNATLQEDDATVPTKVDDTPATKKDDKATCPSDSVAPFLTEVNVVFSEDDGTVIPKLEAETQEDGFDPPSPVEQLSPHDASPTSTERKIKFHFNRKIIESNPITGLTSTMEWESDTEQTDPISSSQVSTTSTTKKKMKKRKSLNGYRCSFCTKIFNYKSALDKHLFIHTKPFVCHHCNKGWPSPSALQLHISRMHDPAKVKVKSTEVKIRQCDQCPFTTKIYCSLYSHKKDHGTNHKHKCTACTCTYRSLAGLRRHIYRVHPSLTQEIKDSKKKPKKIPKIQSADKSTRNLIPCVVCSKPINIMCMTAHRKLYHPEVKLYYCRECPYTSNSHSTIWSHRKYHTTSNKFQCSECTASYSTLAKVNWHIRLTHPDVPTMQSKNGVGDKGSAGVPKPRKEFKCNICSKTFSCDSNLQRHIGNHTKPYHCNKCPRRFPDKYALKHHLKKGHRMNRLERVKLRERQRQIGKRAAMAAAAPQPCPVCDGLFSGGIQKLRLHLKLYHPTYEAYECAECPFQTASEGKLHRHSLIHQAADIFKCDHCTASFGTLTNRERHIQEVHHDVTPDLSAPSLSPRKAAVHPTGYYKVIESLELEKEGHRNGIKQDCRLCPEKFSSRTAYEAHFSQKHPDKKPYKCENCPFECINYNTLATHERHHYEQNVLKCDHCSASFGSLRSKNIHIKTVHKDEVPVQAAVVETPEVKIEPFSSKRPLSPSLDPRIVIVQTISLQKADIPAAATPTPSPASFKCSECPKSFPFRMALGLHQRKFHSSVVQKEGQT